MTHTHEAPARTGVNLTQFPAACLTGENGGPVDWSDHRAAHRAVMRLFAPRLDGPPDQRRERAGILYRVDVATNGDGSPEATVLVQSLVAPEVIPAVARTVEVSQRAWTPEPGERVAFRASVNPVRRTTRYYSDTAKREVKPNPHDDQIGGRRLRTNTKQTASVVPVAEIPVWLAERIGAAMRDIEIVSHNRDTTISGHHKVIVDTIDAVANVADPAALDAVRRTGIGRAKAYGCGLLTIKRVG